MSATATTQVFPVRDYDLAATLSSGQAFRWRGCGPISYLSPSDGERVGVRGPRFNASAQFWTGIVHGRWVRLTAEPTGIRAEVAAPVSDWHWLTHYLQLDLDLAEVLRTFPDDPPMRAAVSAFHGLRLLRQDPWECLASFILSSTKQIVQIQQIVALLCERFGMTAAVPAGEAPAHAFPDPSRLTGATEADLRACKMGFRAPYLLATARQIASGQCNLQRLHELPVERARAELMQLPGVGRKIADCVLLFAYGFQSAFPVDVWVMKALQQLYFPRRRVPLARLHRFAAEHFGPNAGYAQQYLFHYMRTRAAGQSRSSAAD